MSNGWDKIKDMDFVNYGGLTNYEGKLFVANFLNKCSSILDVGCGNGLVYKALKELNLPIEKYKGIDLTEKFIAACKQLYPEREWEVGNADELHEKDNSYDAVLLVHVHESMPSYEKSIKEALRVAKKKVIIVFWRGLGDSDLDSVNYDKVHGTDTCASVFSASKFFAFMKELGFNYFPWVELYTYEDHRYNIYFILDKEQKKLAMANI